MSLSVQEPPVQTIRWYDIGKLDDIPLRGSRRVEIDNIKIGLFRTATDQVFAIEDSCPHKGGPLSEGIVHDNCVTCPLHNWVISLATGEAQGADEGQIKVYPVKVRAQRIELGLDMPLPIDSSD